MHHPEGAPELPPADAGDSGEVSSSSLVVLYASECFSVPCGQEEDEKKEKGSSKEGKKSGKKKASKAAGKSLKETMTPIHLPLEFFASQVHLPDPRTDFSSTARDTVPSWIRDEQATCTWFPEAFLLGGFRSSCRLSMMQVCASRRRGNQQ